MKNATAADVKEARESGAMQENVMYKAYGLLVHGKRAYGNTRADVAKAYSQVTGGDCVLAETSDGLLLAVEISRLEPLVEGIAQQPKKPRRKPVKGTRPEKLIPMSAGVKLKVGDKVVLANGVRTTVNKVDNVGADLPYYLPGKGWYCPAGIYCIGVSGDEHSITHKIVPWQEQNHLYIDGKIAGVVTNLKFTPRQEKSPEQEAFERGYWIPHNATHSSVCPPFATGWKVDYLMRDMQSSRATSAENLRWNAKGYNADIVAFRKAANQ